MPRWLFDMMTAKMEVIIAVKAISSENLREGFVMSEVVVKEVVDSGLRTSRWKRKLKSDVAAIN